MSRYLGENIKGTFTIVGQSGPVNADSLPTATIWRNAAQTAEVVTIEPAGALGVYKYSFAIPLVWTVGDSIELHISVVVGGVSDASQIDIGIIQYTESPYTANISIIHNVWIESQSNFTFYESVICGLVQWRDICQTDLKSIPYVNDLPGFPVDAFELLSDKDFDTAQKVWNKIQKRATQFLVADISACLRDISGQKSVVKEETTGKWVDPASQTTIENYLRGNRIILDGSENIELYIHHIKIYVENYVDTDIDSSIEIYDMSEDQLVESISFTATQNGMLTIPIGKTYRSKSIAVLWDSSEIQSRQTADNTGQSDCYSCQDEYRNHVQRSAKISHIQPVRFDKSLNVSTDTLEKVDNSGLIVKYSVNCGLTDWLYKNKGILTNIYQLALGVEIATEIAASRRINEVTLASEQLDEFAQYCNNGYQSQIEKFVKKAEINDPLCVPCRSKVRKISFLP